MRFPLHLIFSRGSVFRQGLYDKLDDPKFGEGETKAKYFVVLNTSPDDDPIVYLLTTSEKPKHRNAPFMFRIAVGSYSFFSKTTLIDFATAGNPDLSISKEAFGALYDSEDVEYCGRLTSRDIAALMESIRTCPVVPNRFKQLLGLK